MGLMDKLKNIFFEEDDDDDDDFEDTKPLKTTKKEEKIARKVEIKKEKEEEKEEIKKEEKVEEKKEEKKEDKVEVKTTKLNTELIFDDDDFIFDTKPIEIVKEEPKKEIKKRETPVISKKVEIPVSKPKEVKVEAKQEKVESVKPKESFIYTKKVETKTKTFTPSPIISPIYGILDKNYRKEEVKENTEIRLSSRPSRVDFDSVRNKAFGDLEYDLFEDAKEEEVKVDPKEVELEEEKREKNKKKIEKITKSDDDSKPTIDKVTIGEADEYYNDLGLAYNTDYKDLSKEQNDGKVEKKSKENNLEDNLFDLIESMYDKED